MFEFLHFLLFRSLFRRSSSTIAPESRCYPSVWPTSPKTSPRTLRTSGFSEFMIRFCCSTVQSKFYSLSSKSIFPLSLVRYFSTPFRTVSLLWSVLFEASIPAHQNGNELTSPFYLIPTSGFCFCHPICAGFSPTLQSCSSIKELL